MVIDCHDHLSAPAELQANKAWYSRIAAAASADADLIAAANKREIASCRR
ncbi:MAG: hypothetical protein V4610_14110 [Pseudomonadota bacterium]|jgi:hypothetical protein